MNPVARRNVAGGSSIAWALQAARWTAGDQSSPAIHSPSDTGPPCSQVARACIDRGLSCPLALAMPDAARLPLVCRTAGRGWGVVIGRTPAGLWVTRYASGEAHVTALALHNACYASADSARPLPTCPKAPPPLVLVSGVACDPLAGSGWQYTGTAIAMLLALLLGVQLIRWLSRGWFRGRWPLLSRRAVEIRFALQCERGPRRAGVSQASACRRLPVPQGRDAMGST